MKTQTFAQAFELVTSALNCGTQLIGQPEPLIENGRQAGWKFDLWYADRFAWRSVDILGVRFHSNHPEALREPGAQFVRNGYRCVVEVRRVGADRVERLARRIFETVGDLGRLFCASCHADETQTNDAPGSMGYEQDTLQNAKDLAKALTRGESVWLDVEHTLSGDYCGSVVGDANCAELVREFEALIEREILVERHADYSSKWLILRVCDANHPQTVLCLDRHDEPFQELLESLNALRDYPCVDDEAVSAREAELADEAWESWARHDFTRALSKEYGDEFDALEDSETIDFRQVFETLREKTNRYWEAQQSDVWVDVEKVVAETSLSDLCSAIADARIETQTNPTNETQTNPATSNH